jgi:hypothetical protein
MDYQKLTFFNFYDEISSEEKAIELVWKWKLDGKDFACFCGHDQFYKHKSRAEIRECQKCGKQHRARVGTIFQASKISLQKWLNGLFFYDVWQRRDLGIGVAKAFGYKKLSNSLVMLEKIRRALIDRDALYKLSGEIELDGSQFGSQISETNKEVLIGIESKKCVDKNGKEKSKAGFAQIMIGKENKENAKKFISKNIKTDSVLFVDGARAFEIDDDKREIKV